MHEFDPRPMWRRHPLLTCALVLVPLVSLGSCLESVNYMGAAYPFHGKSYATQINSWCGAGVATLVLWVGLLVVAWRHRRRERPDWACPSCSYDRTGIAVGAPCPECGAK